MSRYKNLYPILTKVFCFSSDLLKPNRIKVAREITQIQFPKNLIFISTGLAFLWPIKKSKEPIDQEKLKKLSVIDDSDELFENGHYEECYNLLKNYEENQDIEIQWRICRALYNMAKESKYNNAQKKDFIFQAYEIISKHLNNNENNFAVHKWYALILDAKSHHNGIKERIQQLENVKKHMDLAVTLNPNDATTLHMLGEWCYQITEMPWHQRKIAEVLFASPPHSTYEDALEYFLRAETIQPRFYSVNLLRLGICYHKLGKEDQAKYYLKLAASYPAKSDRKSVV